MFQVQSILKATKSKKQAYQWIGSKEAQELIVELESKEIPREEIYDNKFDMPDEWEIICGGDYVNSSLVDDVIRWATAKESAPKKKASTKSTKSPESLLDDSEGDSAGRWANELARELMQNQLTMTMNSFNITISLD